MVRIHGFDAAAGDAQAWAASGVDRLVVDAPDEAECLVFARPVDDDLHALLAAHAPRPGVAWIETPVASATPDSLSTAAAGGIAFDVSTALAYATPLATLFCGQLAAVCALGDGDGRSRIELAAHEAASNAILHGNLGLEDDWRVNPAAFRKRAAAVRDALADDARAQRRIVLAAAWTDAELVISIVDEGPGYSRETIDAAKTRSGRGLSIVVAHADDVAFEDGGRIIRLTFAR